MWKLTINSLFQSDKGNEVYPLIIKNPPELSKGGNSGGF